MPAFEFGPFHIDTKERRLSRAGVRIPLTLKAFDILELLVEARGRLVDRDTFQRRLWPDTVVEDRNLTVNISTLRKALNAEGGDFIETVPRVGYRLTVSVRAVGPETSDATPERPPIVVSHPFEAAAVPPAALVPPAKAARPGRLVLAIGLAMAALAGWWWIPRPGPAAPAGAETRHIAVLPFTANGGEEARLGVGLADALITRLAMLPELTVRPLSSVRPYSETEDLASMGRTLQVEEIVVGVVQRDGDRVRVSARVINVASGATSWSDQFEKPFTNLFDLQEQIAVAVAGSLARRLSVERTWSAMPRPANDEAYRAYLDGKALMQANPELDVSAAVASFQRAVGLDPGYAPAWAALARAYRSQGYVTNGDPHAARPRAVQASERALALDPNLAQAHTVRGILKFCYEWDWPGAEADFRRAVALDARSDDAQWWLGYFLYSMGRFDEGIAVLREAQRINPMRQATGIAEALWFSGRVDESLGVFEETLRRHPTANRVRWLRIILLDSVKRHDESVAARREAARMSGDAAYLAELERAVPAGMPAVFRLDQRRAIATRNYADLAWNHIQLGETELALDALETCADQLCVHVPLLMTQVMFRPLHGHPRFKALARRLRLDGFAVPYS
jgi:DNA-binding winged helix-turn-helix (wHTH) protein/TolB-like protein